jgi:hypothetical protein
LGVCCTFRSVHGMSCRTMPEKLCQVLHLAHMACQLRADMLQLMRDAQAMRHGHGPLMSMKHTDNRSMYLPCSNRLRE